MKKTSKRVKKDVTAGNWMIVGTYFTDAEGKIHEGVDILINTNDPMYEELVRDYPKDVRPYNNKELDLGLIDEAIGKPTLNIDNK